MWARKEVFAMLKAFFFLKYLCELIFVIFVMNKVTHFDQRRNDFRKISNDRDVRQQQQTPIMTSI